MHIKGVAPAPQGISRRTRGTACTAHCAFAFFALWNRATLAWPPQPTFGSSSSKQTQDQQYQSSHQVNNALALTQCAWRDAEFDCYAANCRLPRLRSMVGFCLLANFSRDIVSKLHHMSLWLCLVQHLWPCKCAWANGALAKPANKNHQENDDRHLIDQVLCIFCHHECA